jgi:hypothetical protein
MTIFGEDRALSETAGQSVFIHEIRSKSCMDLGPTPAGVGFLWFLQIRFSVGTGAVNNFSLLFLI